jgi:hypothetical protein
MLARRLATILPVIMLAEAVDTTRIHRVAGRTGGRTAGVTTRSCRAPHYTISDVGLIGGGQVPMPGEVSLARHGMNLSHYYVMDPHAHHDNGKKRVEARGETFPAHDQSAVLPLQPGKRPLDLDARDLLFDRSPPRFATLPHPVGNPGPDTPCAEG